MNVTVIERQGWELRVRPWRNPRTGITSVDELSITAIHRERGWVQKLDRQSAVDVERFDPESAWQVGLMRSTFARHTITTTT